MSLNKIILVDDDRRIIERFWSKVNKDTSNGCWEWQAYINKGGYGQFALRHGETVRAARFAYELARGQIPHTLTIDHLCMNRACVNPVHLEAVTSKENNQRSNSLTAQNARKKYCKYGHPLSGANLYTRIDGRGRDCLACNNERQRQRQHRLRLGDRACKSGH